MQIILMYGKTLNREGLPRKPSLDDEPESSYSP